ncbi:unnamed protein product [Allacma fusca]|uniref:Uncharacterized protein n=1 Tax=Allacma fusca TaxID=39272 RepID=A0A8J2NX25_9HEXA|nr:unnamed protein product [Allacma fusca]
MTSSNFRTTSGLDERVFPKIDSVPPLSVKISTEMECEDSSVRYFSTSSYIIDSLSEEVPGGNSKERVYSLAKRQNSTTSQTNCRLFEGHGSSPVWVTYDPKRPVSDQSSVEPTCSSKVASFRPSQRMATKRDACGHVVFNEDWGYIAGLDYRARDNSDIRAPKSIPTIS